MENPRLPTDRKRSNLEAIVAAKKTFWRNMATYAGLGTEVYHGFASPDLRVFLGMNWMF